MHIGCEISTGLDINSYVKEVESSIFHLLICEIKKWDLLQSFYEKPDMRMGFENRKNTIHLSQVCNGVDFFPSAFGLLI